MLRSTTLVFLLASTTATAQTLTSSATYNLSSNLSLPSSNFHPQGLGIDESTGRLVYAQQSADFYSSALDGSDVQLLSTAALNHTTSVAVWQGSVYFSDYTSVTNGQDMWRATLPSGSNVAYGTDIDAYGSFPIDIRGDELYRTNDAPSYSWANLNQMIVTDVATPNGGSRTFSVSGTTGIGDFAVDLDTNSIWVLEFTGSARIHRYDLSSTAKLSTSQVVGDGLTAGLTYYNGNLYYYDWVSGNSTLTVYPTGFVAGCTDGMDPLDLNNDGTDETCIHPTAVLDDTVTVEPGARIHANAIIAARAIIGSTADIGAGTIVGRGAVVRGNLEGSVIVGRSAQIVGGSTVKSGSLVGFDSVIDTSDLGPNTVVGSLCTVQGSSVGDDGGAGNVVLARDVVVQTGTTIGSDTVVGPQSELTTTTVGTNVRIRKETLVSAGASIGDDARVGRSCDIRDGASVAGSSRVGARVVVDTNACVSGVVPRGTSVATCN